MNNVLRKNGAEMYAYVIGGIVSLVVIGTMIFVIGEWRATATETVTTTQFVGS